MCNTAPLNSSAIRTQQTRVPSPRVISSAASTCQTSCGAVARRSEEAGRRPGGAGPSPALRNQRFKVRSAGTGLIPCRNR